MSNHAQDKAVFNDHVDTIIEALRAEDYMVRLDKEGASNKKHQLLGVVLCYSDNATQFVCPCYNDLEFELNPIRLKEGKLCVTQKSIGMATSVGLKWFETKSLTYTGSLSMFLTREEELAGLEYTPPPLYVVVVDEPLVSQAEAAANAADAVKDTPAAV
jgi:hypothetical protein